MCFSNVSGPYFILTFPIMGDGPLNLRLICNGSIIRPAKIPEIPQILDIVKARVLQTVCNRVFP